MGVSILLAAPQHCSAQAWTKRRAKRSSNKLVDIDANEVEVDPAVFGDFAAMLNEQSNQGAAKTLRRSRRNNRGSPRAADGAASMETLMSQMAGGGMAEALKGLGGAGGGDIAEMMKGLGDLGGAPPSALIGAIILCWLRAAHSCRNHRHTFTGQD